MGYKNFRYSLVKATKTEAFNNVTFTISDYIVYTTIMRGGDSDSYRYHYIIKFFNKNGSNALFELYIKNSWESIKKHIKIGAEVVASGFYYYDKYNNLIQIQIINFTYKGIVISNKEISCSFGKTPTNRNILEDKKLIIILVGTIISLCFMGLNLLIFGAIFLISAIALIVYVSNNNKKIGKDIDYIFEKSGLEKIDQQHKSIIED